MLQLLQWQNLQRIARHPTSVELSELLSICNQIFWVQFVVGVVGFIPAAFHHALGLETILNVVVPLAGIRCTQEVDPECYRAIRVIALYWAAGTIFGLLQCLFALEWQAFPKVLVKSFIAGIQWVAIARLWRMLKDEKLIKASFFLNVVVLNKKEVVTAQAKSKTGWGDKVGTRNLGRLTSALANHMVTDEKFSNTLGTKMCRNIPIKMAENGIVARADLQLARGNLIVLLVTIEGIDIRKLVAEKAGPERAQQLEKLSPWLRCLPSRVQDDLKDIMLSKTAAGLMQKMPENVAAQLRDMGGVEVAVETKSHEEEAEYLFALLAQLDRQEAE